MLVKLCAFALGLQLLLPNALLGNDGAAEVALGGIKLKQERRVAMVKERLFISKKKVRVEYEFRNDSEQDVTTEIAFPIPDYQYSFAEVWYPFDDFKVWVDSSERSYQVEARAFVGAREITAILQDMGIRIETLGDFKEGEGTYPLVAGQKGVPSSSQMERLSKGDFERLITLGAVDADSSDYRFAHTPRWTVKKTYHWNQAFPKRSTVRIVHEYTPAVGHGGLLQFSDLEKPNPDGYNRNADCGCPDKTLKATLDQAVRFRIAHEDPSQKMYRGDTFGGDWVRYILTTANTWQTPIGDFELIVERDPGEFVTFCWEGPVEKVGANTFRARVKAFIPSKELTIYFLQP